MDILDILLKPPQPFIGLFFSLSSADTGWIPLLQCIGKVVDNVTYTDDFIKNEMTFEKKSQLVSSHQAAL